MILRGDSFCFRVRLSPLLLIAIGLIALLSVASSASTQLYDINHAQVEIVVGTTKSSRRSVNLSVSYPSGRSEYPLIVFSHGHALDNQSYHNLTSYWAERGYFVVAPMHLDSGGDLKATSLVTEKYGRDWIAASRLLEMKAVIDQADHIASLLENFAGTVLTDKVIAAGHSYGALSSQQLSGAKVELQGDSIYPVPPTLMDERVVAVVAISPPGLMKDYLTKATWQSFKTPQLVVTGPNDFFPFIWPNYEEHFVSYLTAQPGSNYLLVLDQMDHYLGNLIGRLERDGPPQTLALRNLQEVSFMFMNTYLPLNFSSKYKNKESQLDDYSEISERVGILRYEHR